MEQEIKNRKVNRGAKVVHVVDQKIIDQAKEEYGENRVKIIGLPLNDEFTEIQEVLASVPDRNVVSQVMLYADKNMKKSQEILVKNCLITHIKEVLADDSLFYTCAGELSKLIPIREGYVKNA